VALVEREPQLESLDAALAATASAGCVVLVAGEAGIGKTALVRAFAERAPRAARIVWSRCDDLVVPRPLGAVRDLSEQATPALGDALHARGRAELLEGVRAELARVPGTVWIVEDVHWADGASLDVLTFLGRGIESLAALIVLTFRDDELPVDHPLHRVLGALAPAAVRRIHVPPLSRDAVAALAGAPADDLYVATGGNAFFVTEAIAAGGELPPPSVRDAVLARAGRLAADARTTLELVAVVPGCGRAVARARGRRGRRTCRVRGTRAAGRRGWCRSLPARARPPRDRGVALRRAARRAARTGPRRAAPLGRRAGATRPSRPRGGRSRQDGRALAAGRPGGGRVARARRGRSALRPRPRPELLDANARAAVLEAFAVESYQAGRADPALAAAQEAVSLRRVEGDASRLADDLRVLSRLLWWAAGDGAAATQAGDEAVELLEPLGASPALAHAYANRAQLLMLSQRTDEAVAVGERAIALAREFGDAAALVHAQTTVGTALAYARGVEAGDALWRDAIRLGIAIGADEQVCRAAVNVAWTAVDWQRLDRAEVDCATALALAEERENRAFRLYSLSTRARLHLARGRWDAAVADAEEVLAQAEGPAVARIPALICLGLVEGRRGQKRGKTLLAETAGMAGDGRAPAPAARRLCARRAGLAAWRRRGGRRSHPGAVRPRARDRERLGGGRARELATARRRPGRRTRLRRAPPPADRR
jgi:tetratricopeptide (TPR) repeat protein